GGHRLRGPPWSSAPRGVAPRGRHPALPGRGGRLPAHRSGSGPGGGGGHRCRAAADARTAAPWTRAGHRRRDRRRPSSGQDRQVTTWVVIVVVAAGSYLFRISMLALAARAGVPAVLERVTLFAVPTAFAALAATSLAGYA